MLVDRHSDRQTDRQTDKQTDKETDRHADHNTPYFYRVGKIMDAGVKHL